MFYHNETDHAKTWEQDPQGNTKVSQQNNQHSKLSTKETENQSLSM